jgi:hypothetical protein
LGDRNDAEFFSKENLAIHRSLEEHESIRLGELCSITASAFYPAATDLYAEGEVPFARCVDCIDYPVLSRRQEKQFERIPRWFLEESGQIRTVKRGEIIITKVGSPCYASIVHDYEEVALSRTVLGLTDIHNVDAYYLTAFLRSRFGFNQLMRQRELTIQYQLTLERVRDVLVFVPSRATQAAVAAVLQRHHDMVVIADNALAAAEQTLLHALGLDAWQPPEPLTYVRRASEVEAAARVDSIYFSPAKTESTVILSRGGFKPLTAYFDPIRDMVAPEDVGTGKRVLNFDVGAAAQPVIDDTSPSVEDFESAKKRFLPGDVIISRLRHYLRQIAVVRTDADAMALGSSEFIVLRPRSTALPQEALVLFLRCLPVQTILKYSQDGSHHPRFSEEDLLAIPVPDSLLALAPQLTAAVRAAHAARREAQALLARAQRAVEVAIEQGEPAALALLKT